MRRGLLTLTPAEQELLHYCLTETTKLPFVAEKIAEAEATTANLQLSEEDAETILDIFPIPKPEENPVLRSLRKKLQLFLAQLRFPE